MNESLNDIRTETRKRNPTWNFKDTLHETPKKFQRNPHETRMNVWIENPRENSLEETLHKKLVNYIKLNRKWNPKDFLNQRLRETSENTTWNANENSKKPWKKQMKL